MIAKEIAPWLMSPPIANATNMIAPMNSANAGHPPAAAP